jgi:CRISPR-associated protein Csm5
MSMPDPRAPSHARRLRLVPLTPIHIGDGTEWGPDGYMIEEGGAQARQYDEYGEEIEGQSQGAPRMLCRFDQAETMRRMTERERGDVARALDRADLGRAAEVLRQAGRRCIVERIAMSAASAGELRAAMRNPLMRAGEVKPFVRTQGRPYIPGSSIKGAFRTALASAALPRDQPPLGHGHMKRRCRRPSASTRRTPATDPLGFLSVSDALLPAGATLIDKTEVVKQGGEPASAPRGKGGGIQMHCERTYTLTDGNNRAVHEVTLTVDERALHDAVFRRTKARFDLSALITCCRDFHVCLFKAESKRFFPSGTTRVVLAALGHHAAPDGRLPFANNTWSSGFVLLRLGRFGHFESKSLEGVRRGHFPQAKTPEDKIRPQGEWGLSRTITRDAKGNPIPFGWVMGWVVKEERP